MPDLNLVVLHGHLIGKDRKLPGGGAEVRIGVVTDEPARAVVVPVRVPSAAAFENAERGAEVKIVGRVDTRLEPSGFDSYVVIVAEDVEVIDERSK